MKLYTYYIKYIQVRQIYLQKQRNKKKKMQKKILQVILFHSANFRQLVLNMIEYKKVRNQCKYKKYYFFDSLIYFIC